MWTPSLKSSEEMSDHTDDFEIIEKASESLCSVSEETYLSLPEDLLISIPVTEIKTSIENCKALILSTPENSDKWKWLVRRLTELQIRMENEELTGENITDSNLNKKHQVVLGHHFSLQYIATPSLQYYCDRCSGIILNTFHNWYLCADCNYKCHAKCLKSVCRICAHLVVSENPVYILDICPEAEDGLANQNYRCAECLGHVFFRTDVMKPRLCDYNGKYYCSTCHWNSTSVIPARVILNWDFKERMVCRSSKQILNMMARLPILNLEELNPVLFACVEELAEVKQLRQQMMQIKKYLISCESAVKTKILLKIVDKQHFLENDYIYSLQDLLELHSGELTRYLNKCKENLIKHIKLYCEVCKGRGYFCELCKGNTIIFPFEENTISCSNCQSTFHFLCWVKNNQLCPKCKRIQERLLKNQSDASHLVES